MSWTKSLKRGVPLLDRKEGDLLLDALIDDAERGGERIDIRRVPAGIYMSDDCQRYEFSHDGSTTQAIQSCPVFESYQQTAMKAV